jgi:hypothetical protein
MPRQPKLRKKKTGTATYWFTAAAGDTYFGNVATVSFKEARSLFNDHIQSLSENQEDSKRKGLTASDLVELFLGWIEKNRSKDTYEARRTHCNRFINFRVGSQSRIADLAGPRRDFASFSMNSASGMWTWFQSRTVSPWHHLPVDCTLGFSPPSLSTKRSAVPSGSMRANR